MPAAVDTVEVAREVRRSLGFGNEAPLPDLLQVIEEGAGVAVALLELPHKVACAYARKEGRGYIFVNASQDLDAQRFALAHSFGHHVLGHRDTIDAEEDLFGAPKTPAEASANKFSAEFLAPAPAVARSLRSWDLTTAADAARPQTVFRLAKYFGVSPDLASAQLATTPLMRGDDLQRRTLGRDTEEDSATGTVWTPFAIRQDSLALAQQRLPRMPSALQADAMRAYTLGFTPLEMLASALERDEDEMRTWLQANGISAPRDIDGY